MPPHVDPRGSMVLLVFGLIVSMLLKNTVVIKGRISVLDLKEFVLSDGYRVLLQR